jgi:hypothetical protein
MWITKFDRTALIILAHIASSQRVSRSSEQLSNVLLGIPDVFTSREINASFAARIPLFLFLTELARNPQTMFFVLDSHVFIDSYFKLLAETAFCSRILNLLRAALVGGSRPLETPHLEYVVQRLLEAIHKFPAIVLDVFQIVLDLVRELPFFVTQFKPFLNAFLHHLNANPSETLLDMTLQLLVGLSDSDVGLSPHMFRITLIESDYAVARDFLCNNTQIFSPTTSDWYSGLFDIANNSFGG